MSISYSLLRTSLYSIMKMESGIGAMYKKKYCEGDKSTCARYMIATTVGPEFVTTSIYPNMTDQAKKIIAQHKK